MYEIYSIKDVFTHKPAYVYVDMSIATVSNKLKIFDILIKKLQKHIFYEEHNIRLA